MANIGHVLIFSLLGGIFSLVGGIILLSRQRLAKKLVHYVTPFAAGALLGAVFLDLLAEGVEAAEPSTVFMATLAGIILFFFAERFLRWFHHHHQHDEESDPAISLIVVGDTLHNVLDGIAIAAAFLISIPTGIVATIAIAAHEIPQEIGDMSLLLAKGMRQKKVVLVNVVSACATTVAAVATFMLGNVNKLPVGLLLGVSAGFLLYIALSDVIPTLHEHAPTKRLLNLQPLLVVLGVATVWASVWLAHTYVQVEPTDTTVRQMCEELEAQGYMPTQEGAEECLKLVK